MKYLFLIAFFLVQPPKYSSVGKEISAENFISTTEFLSEVNESEASYKVSGIVEEVCQMKGCWMTLKNKNGQNVRITFKDYAFFVPKDLSGKKVIIEGVATKEVIAEDVAKHYAEDANRPYQESDRNQISFEAEGVLIAL